MREMSGRIYDHCAERHTEDSIGGGVHQELLEAWQNAFELPVCSPSKACTELHKELALAPL